MSVEAQLWRVYSSLHMKHARDMAVAAQEIETKELGRSDNRRGYAHQAQVTAAIIFSAITLESTINELFTECALFTYGEQARGLPAIVQKRVKEIYDQSFARQARLRVLDKFDLALTLADKETFDRSRQPYQDADALIAMRNALVHHQPEWKVVGTTEIDEASKLGKKIFQRVGLNPLACDGDPLFPEKCLGANCARWSVITAVDFLGAYFGKMGIANERFPELADIRKSVAEP